MMSLVFLFACYGVGLTLRAVLARVWDPAAPHPAWRARHWRRAVTQDVPWLAWLALLGLWTRHW